MVATLAVQDVAIANAVRNGTLRISCHDDRFGGTYWAISDEHGIIEVCLTTEEVRERTAIADSILPPARKGPPADWVPA